MPARHPVCPWLVLVLVCLGQFMVILDATIVNVALPSIQDDLQFSATDLQWVINSYTLVFGGFLLLGGRAADLVGRRRLFVAGVIVFSVAFLPITVGIVAGSGLSQVLVRTIGVRETTTLGMLLAAFGLFMLTRTAVDSTYVGTLLPGMLPMSIGMGLTFVPVTLIATTNVGPEDAGLASGLFNTSQQVGGALGLAVLSTLAADRTASSDAPGPIALVDGFHVAFAGAGILMLVGVVLLAVLVRKRDVANVNPAQPVMPGA
jgi:MFS family permease